MVLEFHKKFTSLGFVDIKSTHPEVQLAIMQLHRALATHHSDEIQAMQLSINDVLDFDSPPHVHVTHRVRENTDIQQAPWRTRMYKRDD